VKKLQPNRTQLDKSKIRNQKTIIEYSKRIKEELNYIVKDPVHVIFIDFQQVYDSILRNRLWFVLIRFKITKKPVNLLKCCNSSTFCKVRFLGDASKVFEVRCGLK